MVDQWRVTGPTWLRNLIVPKMIDFGADGDILITNHLGPKAVVRFPTQDEQTRGVTEVARNKRLAEMRKRGNKSRS